MVFFEYDAEAEKRVIYKDGVEEGRAKEIVRSCKDFNLSKEDAIHKLETLLSIPTQSAIDYYEKFSNAELSISTQAAMDYYDNFSKELEKKSLDDQKAL